MIQCTDCEFFRRDPSGRPEFACDPFSTIKEPECLAKLQLISLNRLVAGYARMLQWYDQLAPLQNKLFKYMQREIDDIDESDRWKTEDDQDGGNGL